MNIEYINSIPISYIREKIDELSSDDSIHAKSDKLALEKLIEDWFEEQLSEIGASYNL